MGTRRDARARPSTAESAEVAQRRPSVGERWIPRTAVGVILAAAGVFLALLLLNVRNHRFYVGSPADALYYFGLPAVLAGATLALLRLPPAWRVSAALCYLAAALGLYAAELHLLVAQRSLLEEATRARGLDFDGRRLLEVVADLRRAGVPAYPPVPAKDLLVEDENGALVSPIEGDGGPLLPLGAVPERTIVECNEGGRWLVYESDRHGFRNPAAAWEGRPALALIGDSFVHGDCVDDGATIAGLLRRGHARVLNLGVSGFGPLSMLASIKEYLPELAPATVLWFFFEGNDITKDLPLECNSELLMSYLRPGFRQGLAERRDEVARRLGDYLDRRMAEAYGRFEHPYEDVLDYFKLYRLREAFGLDSISIGAVGGVTEEGFGLFRAVLAEAKRTVESWGGRLVFVYLPSSERYFGRALHGRIRDHLREQALGAAAELGLPIVDAHPVFEAESDPTALFRYSGSHYNEAGYRAVAEAIERALGRPSN
jgi:hypothetical protein